ncbi:hypothetical protein [Streptomyces sp. HUAS ZL42]
MSGVKRPRHETVVGGGVLAESAPATARLPVMLPLPAIDAPLN